MGTKINQLLLNQPPGTVFLTSWLNKNGYSYALQQQYRLNGWFESLGRGAMIRSGGERRLNAAISAMQQQGKMEVHAGGRTSLGLQGLSHYLELYRRETLLFALPGCGLPSWLTNNQWDTTPLLYNTGFIPSLTGLTEFESGLDTIVISAPARAMMECISMTPDRFDLLEAYEIMESLNFLPPDEVQQLLEECVSVKVKRIFLFLAGKCGHPWLHKLHPERIDLGKGKRSFANQGVFIKKYLITVPRELA